MIFLYQTVLKKAEGGYAVGANGEELRLIEPFQIRVGQRVWTDGKVIFGYVRPKSSEFVFPTLDSGIPVLCDNRKGYFTKKGVWKNYLLAEHDFIVNNKNIFFGGDNINQQGEKIFDAVINDDGEIFSVRWNDNFRYYHTGYAPPYTMPINIYKGEKIFESIKIKNFGDELFNKCDEMFKSVGGIDHSVGWTCFYILEIQSFNIDKDGNFDFFVFGSGTSEGRIIVTPDPFITQYYYPLNMYTALYHVQNENVTKIASHVYGSRIDHTFDGEYIFRQQTGEGSFVMNKFGQISFYDSDKKILAENLPIEENFFHIEINSFSEMFTADGSRREAKAEYTIYTPDGKTTTGISTPYTTDNYVKEGFFSKNADGSLKRFDFKPIIKKLSDGKYLFGNHGGKLYLKTGDNIQEVGNNFKNFRLEELKNIKKAKSKE